ncbi:unnamed protein product [Rhodiola kirilowii]
MSRCFPFPPPGYEKKISTTQLDLLKKEKHREKKHKKEKKDREKKDGKEKKDKDKSDGKSRDKKDKKEKHRDKKKEKRSDKERQTENPSTSGDTRYKVQPEGRDGQKANQKNLDKSILLGDSMVSGETVGYNEGNNGHYASLAREPNGAKYSQDVDMRVIDNAKRGVCPIGDKISPLPHKRTEEGGAFYQNSHLGSNSKDSNLAVELDWRLKNEAEQPYDRSQTFNKLISANQKTDGGVIKLVSSDSMERGDKRITGSNGRYVGDQSTGVKMAPYASGHAHGNHDRMLRPSLSSNTEKITEGQERIKNQEDELPHRGKKRKDGDRNGKRSHGKERSEDKGNNKSDQKSTEQGTRESHKMEILCAPNKEMFHSRVHNNSYISNDEISEQSKELLTNAISMVTGPNKLSRPSSSFHLHSENGKTPEPRQIPLKPSPDGQGATNIFKVDKVGKVNGIIDTLVQRPATEQVIQARPQSPHPDTKRLIEVLSVPKIEELSEIDDSDWLISSNKGQEKKHKVDGSHTSTIADTPHVWSKATTINPADVCALPYVIPY